MFSVRASLSQKFSMSAFAALRTATRSARLTRATIPNRVAALSSSRIGVAAARRFYSSDEKSAGESSGSTATEAEGKKEDATALTEEQKLLAAKDAEILDLTVCVTSSSRSCARVTSCRYLLSCSGIFTTTSN